MIETNVSTLKIHKLTLAQYEREREAGRLDENALYLTPDESVDLSLYVTIDKLNASVADALALAKASGEFDGKDGTNGTNGKDGKGIKSVARTSGTGADGTTDTYTITYTDNTTSTFTVYNGKNGTNGTNGTSVTVKSVSESAADGGSNVVTFSDGKTLTVKNGKTGAAGKDYVLTDADKAEIAAMVLADMPQAVTYTGEVEVV